MDEDAIPNDQGNEDDLAKYNLDDYDKESKSIGVLQCATVYVMSDNRSQQPALLVT